MVNYLKKSRALSLGIFLFASCATTLPAQMITGIWNGRINRQKVEVKIVQQGDSLTGTAYYYESANNYRRYTIKGAFDPETNGVVWWDDQLIEEKTGRFSLGGPGKNPLLSSADFNCPGGGTMMLDGKAALRDNIDQSKGEVHLDKTDESNFKDEWDELIENYTAGGNDPEWIDSLSVIVHRPVIIQEQPVTIPVRQDEKPIDSSGSKKPVTVPVIEKPKETVASQQPVINFKKEVLPPLTIQEKFLQRKKVLTLEIPVKGDSIELRFYDNAEIDGDSISLFLNDRLIFEHIRLLGSAYRIKIAVNELNDTNELIMVAENLGSIPPNTSYMVAIVGEQRYEARLESTEGSSALIRLKKSP